ncbi:MAG: bacillithiol biosynthesis deacetylase BshB1 [Truepera sp.]|nr:bacillithiol biosynthesis deacetylase BshB1 [Truepera sp.]MDE0098854.1 bacillithiol biosynthesis deacetylase BshB1 [Truepera sp.]MDE0529056.1 bacillithiol biosynthesis deacetylase BshB1 [Truepera sp.]
MIDFLVVGPHPDDAELGLGGSLARAKREGRTTAIVDLTRGEAATKGTPEQRTLEAEAASRVLELDVRRNLGWPDSRITDSEDRRLQLARVFRELKPAVVAAPHPNDRHPDHVTAANIVPASLHLAGLKNSPLSGEPFKPRHLFFYMGNGPFEAKLVVDTSDFIEIWEAAVRCYRSQFTGEVASETVTPDIFRRRRGRAAYWGTFIDARYGEPLWTPRPVAYAPF